VGSAGLEGHCGSGNRTCPPNPARAPLSCAVSEMKQDPCGVHATAPQWGRSLFQDGYAANGVFYCDSCISDIAPNGPPPPPWGAVFLVGPAAVSGFRSFANPRPWAMQWAVMQCMLRMKRPKCSKCWRGASAGVVEGGLRSRYSCRIIRRSSRSQELLSKLGIIKSEV